MNLYRPGFARYFDYFATDWTMAIAPLLADWLGVDPPAGQRQLLDACCGGGIVACHFALRGWDVIGVDLSAGMLEVARDRADRSGVSVTWLEQDVRALALEAKVDAVTCLDGALNHVASLDQMEGVLRQFRSVMRPRARLVFDLYERSHFRHWNNVSLVEADGDVVAKRGVWDDETSHGMLRVSGTHLHDGVPVRFEQVLESWCFAPADIRSLLSMVGLASVGLDLPAAARKCHSGTCSVRSEPCRTIFAVTLADTGN